MHVRRYAVTALLALAASLGAQTLQIDAVLKQLDAASAKFRSAQADVQSDVYTKLVHSHDTESGCTYFERSGGGTKFGAAYFTNSSGCKQGAVASKIYLYDGATFQQYAPGNNQVDVIQAGSNKAKYESYLTLGFGSSGHDLAANWVIQDGGPETIGGVNTEKLLLTSKDPAVTKTFAHVTIWVDPARGVSLKQYFETPGCDSRTVTYSNIALNQRLNKKPYEIRKDANKVTH